MDWNDWILQKNAEFALDKLGISREEYLEKALFQSKSPAAKRFETAQNPKTHPDVIHNIVTGNMPVKHSNGDFRKYYGRSLILNAIGNPKTHSKTLDHVLNMDENAAKLRGISPDELRDIHIDALSHPNVSQDQLHRFSTHPDGQTSYHAMMNPKTSLETHQNFANNVTDRTRLYSHLIRNKNVDRSLVEKLANHPDPGVASNAKYELIFGRFASPPQGMQPSMSRPASVKI